MCPHTSTSVRVSTSFVRGLPYVGYLLCWYVYAFLLQYLRGVPSTLMDRHTHLLTRWARATVSVVPAHATRSAVQSAQLYVQQWVIFFYLLRKPADPRG